VPRKGGGHRLYVNGGMRAAAGVGVGDRVRIELQPLAAGEVGLPPDLESALADARRRRDFEDLEDSHRRELVRLVESAVTASSRRARVAEVLGQLRGEPVPRPRVAAVEKPLWACPKCGHAFVTKNMNHSCARHELDEPFRGKPPHVRALFDRFRQMVDERGPTTMIVYRDRVGFMVKVRFGGATPRRDHLELGFWFAERDDDPRFSKVETLTANAHVHRARIRALGDLDDTVRKWIDRAYRVGCRHHLRHP
jgi:hypothetical protein